MKENLSPEGLILEVLGDLELNILKPLEKTEGGYELMFSFPKEKKYTKGILKSSMENRKIHVHDIDVFREKNDRYAWAVVNPYAWEEKIG